MTSVEILSGGQLKRGDTEPPLRVRLINDNGNPFVVPSGWDGTVTIVPANSDEKTVDAASLTVVSSDNGIVEYDWGDGDTDETGTYQAEFRMFEEDNSGNIIQMMTFPNDRYLPVRIMEEL